MKWLRIVFYHFLHDLIFCSVIFSIFESVVFNLKKNKIKKNCLQVVWHFLEGMIIFSKMQFCCCFSIKFIILNIHYFKSQKEKECLGLYKFVSYDKHNHQQHTNWYYMKFSHYFRTKMKFLLVTAGACVCILFQNQDEISASNCWRLCLHVISWNF